MGKYCSIILTVFFSLVLLSCCASADEKHTVDVSGRAVNSTPLYGPEGIVIAPSGDIFIGNHDGKIMQVAADGSVKAFADLNDLPGDREETIRAVGVAMDKEGDIYAATYDFHDGAVLKVIGPGRENARTVTLYRHGIGLANFVLIDDETGTMYVTDCSMRSGGVFGIDMKDESRIGSAVDREKELLGKFGYANGLALGPSKQWLYVAETTAGRISRIHLKTKKSETFIELGGWMDGLVLDPERNALFACDNKKGRIIAVDLSCTVLGEVHLIGREGQCAPACLVFRDSDTIVFTDLWKASTWRALLGMGQYHSYIYQLPVSEVIR